MEVYQKEYQNVQILGEKKMYIIHWYISLEFIDLAQDQSIRSTTIWN